MYDTLKLIHVLAVIAWVGGVILVNLYAAVEMRRGDRAALASLNRLAEFGGRVFMVTGIIALAAGVWMVIDSEIIDFSQAWITIGFAGILVGATLGPAFYNPTSRRLGAALESGDLATSQQLGRRIGLVSNLEMLLLLVAVWAMVFKPGL